MLSNFYIPRLSNDMNITVQKHLGGQIWYRSLDQSCPGAGNFWLRLRLLLKNGVSRNILFGNSVLY